MSITKLHTPLTKITLALFTAASSLVLSSCQDEDYGFTTQDVRDGVYKRNFEKTYGNISDVPTWDFSSYNLKKMGLTGGPNISSSISGPQTRATSGLVTKYPEDTYADWYTVEPTTITWLNEHLKEKVDNTTYTSPFEWVPDAGSAKGVFYVIPIYQGQTGMVWNLELVDIISTTGRINTSSIIWTKSENIQYTQDYSQWEEFFYESGQDSPYSNENNYSKLKFTNVLSGMTSSTSDVKIAFSVSTTVTGAFYVGDTKLTYSNAESFFRANGKTEDGDFTFTTGKNVAIVPITDSSGDRQKLSKSSYTDGNIIDLSSLTSDYSLKNLSFQITNSIPESQRFQHWSRDYIRVFVHYNGGGEAKTVKLSDFDTNGQNSYLKHNTVNKYHVQTRPIKIDMNCIEGSSFAFNLKTIKRTDGDSPYSEIGDDHRSDQNFMSLITHFDEPVISNKLDFKDEMYDKFGIELDDNFEYKVIGCEDAGYNGKGSDQDYNDVVFLLVGDKLPNQVVKKRYMIEDLGSTLDFDFNDIVVDVTETVTSNDDGTKNYKQEAKIRHLCGTIPFRVKIGNKYFGNVDGNSSPIMRGHNTGDHDLYDPSSLHSADYSWTVTEENVSADSKPQLRTTHWDPEANNISIEVWPSYASENNNLDDIYWTGGTNDKADNSGADKNNVQVRQIVEFPKTGKVPYIIATDQNVMWMEECHNIPNQWVSTKPQNYPNYPTFPMGNYVPDAIAGSGTGNVGDYGNKLTNKTSVTAGSIVLNNTESAFASSTINISKDDIAKAYIGDVLVVKVTGDVYDSSRLTFTQTGTTNGIKNVGTNGSVIVTGDYEIPVTEDVMKSLRANGLTISGTNVTVERVTVRSGDPANQYYNTATYKTKTGANKNIGSWVIAENKIMNKAYATDEAVQIPNSDLKQLYVGDKIVVKLSGLRSDSQIGFKKGWDGWKDITYANYPMAGGAANPDGNNITPTGDITLEITESNIASLRDANGSLIIQGNKITIESVSIETTSRSLTLSLDDLDKDDFDLYINNEKTSSRRIIPGTTVNIKAKKKSDKSNANYKFMWTGVSGLLDSNDDADVSFTMPDADTSIKSTVLYWTTPQTYLKNGESSTLNADCGSISLSWNGRTSSVVNGTNGIYVPLGSTITATATANSGYAFDSWKFSNGNKNAAYTFTRSNSAKNRDYMPQAEFVAVSSTVTIRAIVNPNNDAGSVTISDQNTSQSGTNSLVVSSGAVNVKLVANASYGYRFFKWGGSRIYTAERTASDDNRTSDWAFYVNFAKNLKTDLNYDYQNYYEFQEYNNKQNDNDLKDLTTESTLVFFFEESSDNSGAFSSAAFSMRKSSNVWEADEISGVKIDKVNDQKLVFVTFDNQDAVDEVKNNGFKLRVSNMGDGKKITHQYFGIVTK